MSSSRMMFKRQEILFTLMSLAILASGVAYFFKNTSHDEAAYRQLMQSADEREPSTKPVAYETQQERIGVGKEFFFLKGNERLACRLKSETSDLKVDYQDGKTTVVEHLQQVHCLMQEELLSGPPSGQLVRSLDAKKATYHYQTDQLHAEGVVIERYRLPGHQLGQSLKGGELLMKGHAKEASFALSGKKLSLQAKVLDATFLKPEQMTISARSADYDGEKALLTGDVVMQHALGKVSARQVAVEAPLISMEGKVLIELNAGGSLVCDKGIIDYDKLKGEFYGSKPVGEVIYTEDNLSRGDAKGKATPLSIRSRQMGMRLSREVNLKYSMAYIEAYGSVNVSYGNDFTTLSDQAHYRRTPSNFAAAMKLPGIITLLMNDEEDFCSVLHRNGDKILAKGISMDTLNRNMTFDHPKGVMISRSDHPDEVIEFFAKKMVWEDETQLLTLSDNVVIDQRGIRNLHTDHDVKIYQHVVDDKKEIKRIVCSKNTTLTFLDADKKGDHVIVCAGPLEIDNEKMTILLKGSGNEQVAFTDHLGQLLADQVTIYYMRQGADKLEMEKIHLEGSVKIYNRQNQTDEDERAKQYALADKVTYVLNSNELNLSSQAGRRVLLFDEANHLQISAPALKIHRDRETNKDSFQGTGDVRFNFVEQEMDQIKELFIPKKR